MFEVIERLKAEWTDKYVVIDSPAPELARFAKTTGQVRTVNMNGRCLVEFDQYNNIGWYDIDPSCLKIIPKPLPKPAEPKAKAAKPAAPAKPAATAAKPAAESAAGGAKKPSTADILAAARGKATAAAGAKKPSTADILAAARGKSAAAAKPAVGAPPQPEPEAESPAETAVAPQQAASPPQKAGGKKPAGSLPTSTADKIAWCRANDTKG